MIRLGPYTQGEIPLPVTILFEDTDLSGYSARFVYRAEENEAVTRNASIPDPTSGRTIYTFVDGDLAVAGTYHAEMWVGDSRNRFRSDLIEYEVGPSIGPVPLI